MSVSERQLAVQLHALPEGPRPKLHREGNRPSQAVRDGDVLDEAADFRILFDSSAVPDK